MAYQDQTRDFGLNYPKKEKWENSLTSLAAREPKTCTRGIKRQSEVREICTKPKSRLKLVPSEFVKMVTFSVANSKNISENGADMKKVTTPTP